MRRRLGEFSEPQLELLRKAYYVMDALAAIKSAPGQLQGVPYQ